MPTGRGLIHRCRLSRWQAKQIKSPSVEGLRRGLWDDLLDRGVIGRGEELGLHTVLDRERTAGLLFGSALGGDPSRVGAESAEAGLGGVFALMVEQVDESIFCDVGALGALLVSGQIPVGHAGHAMLREELQGVIAEAGVQVIQSACFGRIGAQFEDAFYHYSMRKLSHVLKLAKPCI